MATSQHVNEFIPTLGHYMDLTMNTLALGF
jgi:hypothetical protein